MKVVVNKCHGGFGLSHAGEKEYLRRKGLEQFLYTDRRWGTATIPGIERAKDDSFVTYTFTKDLGDSTDKFPDGDDGYFYGRNIPRDDIDLIAVVEEMGKDAN